MISPKFLHSRKFPFFSELFKTNSISNSVGSLLFLYCIKDKNYFSHLKIFYIKNKISILLGLTSNIGAEDIQLKTSNGDFIFMEMIKSSKLWGNHNNMMYVVGATKTDFINKIRSEIPDHFLLIPGIGAQGGDLIEVCKHALNDNIGIIVNSSRSIIYASTDDDFATAAANQAMILQTQMSAIISERK